MCVFILGLSLTINFKEENPIILKSHYKKGHCDYDAVCSKWKVGNFHKSPLIRRKICVRVLRSVLIKGITFSQLVHFFINGRCALPPPLEIAF